MSENTDKSVFQKYADLYDSIYYDKNYDIECDFLEEIFDKYSKTKIKNVLDLGCGTGGHAIPLALRGYNVSGIDFSSKMIDIAREKVKKKKLEEKVCFEIGNVQNFNLKESFDSIICMFAVLGYQITNNELFETLKTIRKSLKKDGLFIFDFWYGPAVIKERPEERIKIIQDGDMRIIRVATPEINIQKSLVTVSYKLFYLQGNQLIKEFKEEHNMRFLFLPELDFFLSQADLKLIRVCPFLKPQYEVNEETWNITAIAVAV